MPTRGADGVAPAVVSELKPTLKAPPTLTPGIVTVTVTVMSPTMPPFGPEMISSVLGIVLLGSLGSTGLSARTNS